MLHPSYTELMEKINKEGEQGEEPVINSRYSIVIATSKRAREIIAGDEPLVSGMEGEKGRHQYPGSAFLYQKRYVFKSRWQVESSLYFISIPGNCYVMHDFLFFSSRCHAFLAFK